MSNESKVVQSGCTTLEPYATKIPYGKQCLGDDELNTVYEALKQPFITQGPEITKFEKDISHYTGAKYACAASSGTAALHAGCLALGLTNNDWLWTSPISFVASANCALYCNAQVDFVDIDPITRNISVTALEEKLTIAKKMNRLPKILVVVHFTGLSVDMQKIRTLSEEYGFFIIEDGCHALGGEYKDKKIGCSEWSDFTMFSFHPVKAITTGEGGMLCTNQSELQARAKKLTQHGITRDPAHMELESHGPWYYEQTMLGYNYRMTDFQAALGRAQLKRLDAFTVQRNEIAAYYHKHLSALPIELPLYRTDEANLHAFHIYVIELTSNAPITRAKLFEELHKLNVCANVHYIPIHLQPFYRKLGFKQGDFPNAEAYYERCLTIPLYVGLTEKEQEHVTRALTCLLS